MRLHVHSSRSRVVIGALITACALNACDSADSAGRTPLGASSGTAATSGAEAAGPTLSSAAQTALEAGNAAYRAKRFDAAITSYRDAAAAAPDHPAPWYGLYMAASETKNSALADSAMQRVKALSADPASLDAHAEVASPSVIPSTPSMPPDHPSTTPPPTPLPSGHPSTDPLPPGHPAPKGASAPVLPKKSLD
jgi:hypothetical protein